MHTCMDAYMPACTKRVASQSTVSFSVYLYEPFMFLQLVLAWIVINDAIARVADGNWSWCWCLVLVVLMVVAAVVVMVVMVVVVVTAAATVVAAAVPAAVVLAGWEHLKCC